MLLRKQCDGIKVEPSFLLAVVEMFGELEDGQPQKPPRNQMRGQMSQLHVIKLNASPIRTLIKQWFKLERSMRYLDVPGDL